MNQLPTTDALIRNIKALITIADIGIERCVEAKKQYENDPDSFMNSFLINTIEDARFASVSLKDFIYRATHDERGEPLK